MSCTSSTGKLTNGRIRSRSKLRRLAGEHLTIARIAKNGHAKSLGLTGSPLHSTLQWVWPIVTFRLGAAMSNRVCRAVRLQLLLVVTPCGLLAQSGAHFEPLSTPSREAGTCMPAIGVDTALLQAHRLVMKSIPPGRQREMTAMVDRQGRRVTSYFEMSMSMTTAASSTNSNIIATFNDGQLLYGSRTDGATAYPESALADPEGLLNGRYQLSVTSTRKPLDESDQRTIKELIEFMRKRCPS